MYRFISILFVFAVTGCVTEIEEVEWPENAYPRAYFQASFREDTLVQQYQSEDDYLLWITRFYNGYSIAPGWLSLTRQVLERLEEPRRSEIRERLYHLGGSIGSEWAKHNDVRTLDTRMAAVWRDALIESLNQDDLDDYIERVEADVISLKAGELHRDDIYFERYYIDEFDF